MTMDAPRSNKRRRLVASCHECHRRKQKCDRQKPCSTCVSRNVQDKCSYADSTIFQQVVFPDTGFQTEPENFIPQEQLYPSESFHPFQLDPSLFPVEDAVVPEPPSETQVPVEEIVPQNEDDLIDPLLRDSDPATQLGYVSGHGNNVHLGLKQLLQDEESFHTVTSPITSPRNRETSEKFWQLSANLPAISTVEKLIDHFFANINWLYSSLDRYYFDDLLTRWTNLTSSKQSDHALETMPTELQYFPGLLLQVIAVSIQFLPADAQLSDLLKETVKSDLDSLAQRYSETGTQITDLLGRHKTDLVAVQQDFLRASYLKNSGRVTESWHALGNAIRQAQELGFHRQFKVQQNGIGQVENTLSLLWYDEYKRRMWINLFIWDSAMAMVLGRPRSINANDCDMKPPMDCDIPSDPSKTVPMAVQLDDKPSAFSERLIQYSIAQKIHEVRTLGADKRHPRDYMLIQQLHNQALSLLDTVPPTLQPHNPDTSWDSQCPFLLEQREQILATVNMYIVALHRPHIITHVESRQAACEAAQVVLESQQRSFARSKCHLYKHFALCFYTVDAAIISSAMAIRYPPKEDESKQRILQNLNQAIARLETMQKKNAVAASGLTIVMRCCRKVQDIYAAEDGSEAHRDTASQVKPPLTKEQQLQKEPIVQQINSGRIHPSSPGDLPGWENADFTDLDSAYWLDHLNQVDMDIFAPSKETIA